MQVLKLYNIQYIRYSLFIASIFIFILKLMRMKMLISNLNFIEERDTEKSWEIKDVNFNLLNLIVGVNATGKTRMLNVLTYLAEILLKKMPLMPGVKSANFKVKLSDGTDNYNYELEIQESEVIKEKLRRNDMLLIDRGIERGQIKSETTSQMSEYNPPHNALTIHARRNEKEYSYLEKILEWAENFYRFDFSGAAPQNIPHSPLQGIQFKGLADVQLLIKELMGDETLNSIGDDFSNIGYPIDKIGLKEMNFPGISHRFISVKEKDLNCMTEQHSMSQGMYRALSVIIILEHLLKLNKSCTICIDDLGEGLDFERSTKLTRLLFSKVAGKKIQLIVTSNDRFLINSVDLKHLNILEREGHITRAYNYLNSKTVFDDFLITGLNNFDFFADKMYREY